MPRIARARDVCSGVTKYGCAPRAALGGEREHLRSQRGEHDRHVFGELRRHEERLAHSVEVVAHRGDGFSVLVTAHLRDQMSVRDAHPEHEAAAAHLAGGEAQRVHRHRIARIDVGDAGGEGDARRMSSEVGDRHERIAADGLGQPQCFVAPRLDARGIGRGLRSRHPVHVGPDSESPQRRHSIFLLGCARSLAERGGTASTAGRSSDAAKALALGVHGEDRRVVAQCYGHTTEPHRFGPK